MPFLFVFQRAFLMQGGSGAAPVLEVGSAAIGVWFVLGGMIGHGVRRMALPARIGAVVAGCPLLPLKIAPRAVIANLAGLALAAAVLVTEAAGRRTTRAADARNAAE